MKIFIEYDSKRYFKRDILSAKILNFILIIQIIQNTKLEFGKIQYSYLKLNGVLYY